MRALDVMTPRVRTISPDATAEDARQLMEQRNIHYLAVAMDSQLIGVISDRDISESPTDAREGRTVANLMTRHVSIVDATVPIRKVANLMRGRSVGCVFVTKNHRLVGVITVTDLLELLGRGIDRPALAGKRRPALHHRAPHRKRHRSTGMW